MGPPHVFDIHRDAFRAERGITFAHTAQLLSALRGGQKSFEATELFTAADAAKWELGSFKDMADKAYFHALNSYTLHDEVQYHDYDSLHGGGMRSLSAETDRLEHCAASKALNKLADVQAHSALVGSSHGGWHPDHATAAASGTAPELLLSHRVLGVSATQDGSSYCVALELEPMHPWEMFSSVQVQALVEHPFHTTYDNQDPEADERKLQFARPDSPLRACSDPVFDDLGRPSTSKVSSLSISRLDWEKGGAERVRTR